MEGSKANKRSNHIRTRKLASGFAALWRFDTPNRPVIVTSVFAYLLNYPVARRIVPLTANTGIGIPSAARFIAKSEPDDKFLKCPVA